MTTSPHRTIINGRYYLDGKPFLIVGGELLNSSSSTQEAIDSSLDALVALGVNTVLAPVAWELIEPEEGIFKWEILDYLQTAASNRNLHLVPLWFGTWKNGMSTYAPAWVKTDPARFPRIETATGQRLESVTPFSESARAADAAAFAAFMTRLRELDDGRTVLLVQVENEVGVLGDERDHSPTANTAWNEVVPGPIVTAATADEGRLRSAWEQAGSHTDSCWEATFAAEAPEAFMAHAYATFIEAVASAGRRAFDVPLFVNAWVDANGESDGGNATTAAAGGVTPGAYPSGGPLRHTASIWRASAPSIDFLAPDMYFGQFNTIASEYRAIDDILFIPEMQSNRFGIGQMFEAVGTHSALGVSPFGVDALTDADEHFPYLSDAFRLLRGLGAVLSTEQPGEMLGFSLSPESPATHFDLNGTQFKITTDHLDRIFPVDYPAYGCIVATGKSTVIAVGRGFAITPVVEDGHVGILSATELDIRAEGLVVTRHLNGDEAGRTIRFPGLNQTQSPDFPISQNVKSTGLVRVTTYRY